MLDPKAIRRTILTMCHKSNMAHLGCSLSVVEMLLAIYQSVDIDKIKANAPDRDHVIISKGHCAAAVYATLAAYGIIDPAELETYAQDGSRLAGLVSHAVPGVELSTGALGHGINVAVGAALGMKRRGYKGRVFVLIGDGEAQEGSVWEALMLASHLRLDNLIIMIDDNGIGSVTETKKIMSLSLPHMINAFGIYPLQTDGHDVEEMKFSIACQAADRPTGIVCKTHKGMGVSFMRDSAIWHYRGLNEETYTHAMAELT